MRHRLPLLWIAVLGVGMLASACGNEPTTPAAPPKPQVVDVEQAILTEQFALAEETRRYIFEAEHLGVVISQDLLSTMRRSRRRQRRIARPGTRPTAS